MADNIKIVGEILNTQEVSRYNSEDIQLLTSQHVNSSFGYNNDYIEYFVYDAVGNFLNGFYNYKDFKLPPTYGITPSSYKDAVAWFGDLAL
jgi:hypothetical protein